MSVKPTGSLTIGLDIGIASVGWAVLAPDRIVALGVRAFDKAETAKEGDSLNLIRRTARLTRRRLHRRAWRSRLSSLRSQPTRATLKKRGASKWKRAGPRSSPARWKPFEYAGSTPEEMAAFLRDQFEVWSRTIRESGIKPE